MLDQVKVGWQFTFSFFIIELLMSCVLGLALHEYASLTLKQFLAKYNIWKLDLSFQIGPHSGRLQVESPMALGEPSPQILD